MSRTPVLDEEDEESDRTECEDDVVRIGPGVKDET